VFNGWSDGLEILQHRIIVRDDFTLGRVDNETKLPSFLDYRHEVGQ
jgi:hypothetical protein